MVAAEAAAAGSPPLVARHSGLAEIAEGIEQEYPPALRRLASFTTGNAAELAAKLRELLALPDPIALRCARPRAPPPYRAGAGQVSPAACSNPSTTFTRMGDEQRLGYEELLRRGAGGLRHGHRLHGRGRGGVRAPRPVTLGLVNRFEDVQAAAQGTPLEPHLVGELIASEVEIKTGRCETFADVPAVMAERRAQLQALVDPMGIALGATGTHPWSPWQEQRIIDTPHYRRNDELLRYVVWRNNSSACTYTSGFATPTGRSRSRTGCATCFRSCSPSPPARPSSRT